MAVGFPSIFFSHSLWLFNDVKALLPEKKKKFKESVSYRRAAINLFLSAVAQVGVSHCDPFPAAIYLHNRQ